MKNYGATELSKMYDCSRGTVYNKLKEPSLQEFIVEEKGKTRLIHNGLKPFGHLIAEMKKTQSVQGYNEQKDVHEQPKYTPPNDVLNHKYIQSLEKQIEELKQEKISLKKEMDELKNREKYLLEKIFERDQFLLMSNEQKLDRSNEHEQNMSKKTFFERIKYVFMHKHDTQSMNKNNNGW
jgi:predicted RNase H-like nuclease (RuvC/YqgF family)